MSRGCLTACHSGSLNVLKLDSISCNKKHALRYAVLHVNKIVLKLAVCSSLNYMLSCVHTTALLFLLYYAAHCT